MLDFFKKHENWFHIKQICEKLNQNDYKAFLAGGCVRDALLNNKPEDFDIATNASPKEIEKIFPRTLDVGKNFGVTIVPIGRSQVVEISTFRQDINYYNGRHPEKVVFASEKEDALRRDFTINAMYYDVANLNLIDLVGGKEDLKRKIIKTVGDPFERFKEDRLRMLRAIRFAARLDFLIEDKTQEAIKMYSLNIKSVSKERLRDELGKIFLFKSRIKAIKLMIKLELIKVIFPFMEERYFEQIIDLFSLLEEKTYQSSKEENLLFLWSLFFLPWSLGLNSEGIVKESCFFYNKEKYQILKSKLYYYKFSRNFIESISKSLCYIDMFRNVSEIREGFIKDLFLQKEGTNIFKLLNILNKKYNKKYNNKEDNNKEDNRNIENRNIQNIDCIENIENLLKKAADWIAKDPPDLIITGSDLLKLGMTSGPKMGKVLKQMRYLQLEGLIDNHKEAVNYVKNKFITRKRDQK